jgi:hypothetical protein
MLLVKSVASAGLCSAILSSATLMARVMLMRARSEAEAARRSRLPSPTALESSRPTLSISSSSRSTSSSWLRKGRTILAGAPFERRKPRAKKPKAEKRSRAQIKADLEHYKIGRDVRTESGAPSVDIRDALAKPLRGCTLDEVYKIAAKELEASEKSLRDAYNHLNNGQQRMTLGNRLRGQARKEKK